MSLFYDNLAATAGRLLSKFGAPVTLTRTNGQSVDPITGAISGGTVTDYTPNAISSDIKLADIDGSRIRMGDRLVVLDATIEPTTADVITIDSTKYSVISVTPKKPTDTALVYIVQVRR